jgi:SAM-dependent methyltransferase
MPIGLTNDRELPASAECLRFSVLHDRAEVRAAAAELRRREWVACGPLGLRLPAAALRRLLRRPRVAPDPIKAWDVLHVLEAIVQSTPRESPVLDLGSLSCPVLPCLHRLGYSDLHGIDLNPEVREMPFAAEIDYRVADMTAAPWPDGSFAAISAVSVIEHGFDRDTLLDEIARLLRPGGLFVFSTDYWAEKINTDDVRMFGLDWQIFSAAEIEELLQAAATRGLRPVHDPRAGLRHPPMPVGPVSFRGGRCTFLYGALVRD